MRYFLLLLSVFVVTSCTPTPELQFNKQGISFTYPSGWNIVDEEARDDMSYYISCEKSGIDESGIVVLIWYQDSIDLEDFLTVYLEGIYDEVVAESGSDMQKDAIQTIPFGNFVAQSLQFRYELYGLDYEGAIYAFYGCEKTFLIVKQEAIIDRKTNHEGFVRIEETLACE